MRRHSYIYMMIGILIVGGIFLFFDQGIQAGTVPEATKILIDPGHGGQDPGKVVGSHKESEINLEFALALSDVLTERGFVVGLTRDNNAGLAENGSWNKDMDMQLRKERIVSSGCDIFISLHQNSYADTSCKGAQVFYSDNLPENMQLADLIQKKIKEISPFENNRIALINNDYFVLRDNRVPSVIVECGFMTNPQELELLTDNEYRSKLTNAIAEAVLEFIYEKMNNFIF